MSDIDGAVPALVALILAAVAVAIVVFVVRTIRRSAKTRAAADAAVAEAADALLRLDDAVVELDAAFEAADADDSGDAPTELRRARTSAHRARDRGFVDVSDLDDASLIPATRRDLARRTRTGLEGQLARTSDTRARLAEWVRAHRSTDRLAAAARERREAVVAAAGDPEPLLDALRHRFDRSDWAEAEASAAAASAALSEADEALSAAPDDEALLRAAREIRRAARHLRAVEDAHRIAFQAAENAEAELAAVRAELDDAVQIATTRGGQCAPDALDRLRAARQDLERAAAEAGGRPREAIVAVARARELRDEMIGDAVSPRLRLEAARAALPGTLACARAALAQADTRDEVRPIADRLRLERARRELAASRAATDAGRALADARAAWHAVPPPQN